MNGECRVPTLDKEQTYKFIFFVKRYLSSKWENPTEFGGAQLIHELFFLFL